MANLGLGVKTSPTWVRNLGTLRAPPPKEILIGLGVCAAYIVAGKLSLRLASVHPSATPVWPPTGIAIATLAALGLRFWPLILTGAVLVNLTTAGSVFTSIGIATGNTLEAVIASFLVMRYANGRHAFEWTKDILRFAFFVVAISTPVAATLGVTSLTLGGFASWSQYGLIWRTWWLGDAAGALIFAPIFHAQIKNDPWTFLCVPFLVWAAFRYGPREASAVICLLCMVEVVGTVHGYGPFVRGTANDSLLLLQSFISLKALMILLFAAEVSERRRQEEHARALAVSDPLTGLANYRLLLDRLDSEIKRYQRDGHPFSVLLLHLA